MRYLPHTPTTRQEMLKAVGASSVEDFYKMVPAEAQNPQYALPDHQSEQTVERNISKMAQKNMSTQKAPCFLGAGYYAHHIPAAVDYITQRGEFMTSYTPYQPEVSQGTLQAIFEFQSYICALTGMEVANASMYDGATATAEAILMANRIQKTKKSGLYIAEGLHPHYKDTVDTYINHSNLVYSSTVNEETACIVVQSPNFFGEVVDLEPYKKQAEEVGALLIHVVTEVVSLGLLPAPKQADIVVGEAQSIGNPLSFGGPSLGFFSCKKSYLRQMPGRLCGTTEDAHGKRSFVLTLNTREQHIRRDKATSNICTNEGLCALAFTVHMSLLGETGFKALAHNNHLKAVELETALTKIDGINLETKNYFNEFTVSLPCNSHSLATHLSNNGIISGLPLDDDKMLFCATETVEIQDIQELTAQILNYLQKN